MIDPKEFYDALVGKGLDFFCGVPDSLLKDFCACVFDNAPEGRNIIAANGAVGMACGYHVSTGKHGVVYMQNSGEGNAVNPLLSIADPEVYGIPMLLVIGWRGEPGVHDEPQHIYQGAVTRRLLDDLEIPSFVLGPETPEEEARRAMEDFRPLLHHSPLDFVGEGFGLRLQFCDHGPDAHKVSGGAVQFGHAHCVNLLNF